MKTTESPSGQVKDSVVVNPAARVRAYVRRRGRRRVLGWVLLALFGCGAAALVVTYRVYRLRARRAEPVPRPAESLPENAQRTAAGYTFTRSEGGHPVFTVRAERSVDFKGGTMLEGVQVEIFGRAGDQHDLLETRRCDYNAQSGNFTCAGRVQIELNAPVRSQGEAHADSTGPQTAGGRQPVYLATSGVTYNQQQSLASTSARVDWRYGPASGSATGLTYAVRGGWLELEHEVSANWPVQEPVEEHASGAGMAANSNRDNVLKLAAARLRYSKDQQQLDLNGPVRVSEGDRKLDAGHAVLYVDSKNRLTHALLDQGVRASEPPDEPGTGPSLTAEAVAVKAEFDPATMNLKALEAQGSVKAQSRQGLTSSVTRLEADHAQVTFSGPHFHPVEGAASGNVHLSADSPPQPSSSASRRSQDGSQPTAGAPSQGSLARETLDAAAVQFSFRPADGTLDHAQTMGPGKVVLTPSKSSKTGARVVTAGQFLMAFDGQSRLETVHGSAPTKVVFEPPPNASATATAGPLESRAQSLDAKLDPDSGAIESLQQSGQFQFFSGDQRATANQAGYSANAQILTLTGDPQLADPDTRIQADRFVVRPATRSAEGRGHVRSIHFGKLVQAPGPPATKLLPPRGQVESPKDGEKARPEGALAAIQSSNTTNVLADRVTADRSSQLIRYEGHVRAWHGTDVVEAPSLDIYRGDRRIVSGAGVVTSDLAAPAARDRATRGNSGKPPAEAAEPVTIRADRLEYFDAGSRAVYRGHVLMSASGATLQADRLDAYFSQRVEGEPTKLDRATADGNVRVTEPGRWARGDHGEYFVAEGKVVMTGGPPSIFDAKEGFATGQTLTFFIQGDSLLVDGGEGSRSFSKHHLSK